MLRSELPSRSELILAPLAELFQQTILRAIEKVTCAGRGEIANQKTFYV